MATIAEAVASIAAVEADAKQRQLARRPAKHDRQRFYTSRAWRVLRYATLRANAQRHGRITCEVCGATAPPFHVDHIVPLSKDWTRRLDPSNVQVQCEPCNLGKGNTNCIDWRPAA